LTGAVEIDGNLDIGFLGGAPKRRLAHDFAKSSDLPAF